MRISVPIVLGLLGLTSMGCGSGTTDPYQQTAQEVDSAAAALGRDGTEVALDGLEDSDADVDDDADESADESTRGDGGVREHHGHQGRGEHGRHPHGRHHGHGHGLLLWFADLDALQACRDLREQCAMSADPSTCKDDVRACVQPILEQAFAAMCEEKLAMCAADGAPERPCAHIAARCGASDPGPTPDPQTPDAG